MNGFRCWTLALLVTLLPQLARAQNQGVTEAKEYFKAGAAAYAAGDYLAAIQALERAHRITPLPAIAFSLAQAERRQYFVSREPARLERAIALFRSYLEQVAIGGRRADATEALSQLEPLRLASNSAPNGEAAPSAAALASETAKTRIMVSSVVPNARIALDGGRAVASPLIAEVAPGEHSIHVSANGYFPSERRLVAIAGELVPIEIELEEKPAAVRIAAPPDADLYVDSLYVGKAGAVLRLELSGGPHVFTFAKKGHHVQTIRADLERGATRPITAKLAHTGQRTAAIVLFAVSGANLASGIAVAAFAVNREDRAQRILERREEGNLDPDEVAQYNRAIRDRNRFRAVAGSNITVAVGAFVVGLLLHELDQPNVKESLPPAKPERTPESVRLGLVVAPGPGELGLGVRLGF